MAMLREALALESHFIIVNDKGHLIVENTVTMYKWYAYVGMGKTKP